MITANLPMYTMKSGIHDRSSATYTVLALETNMTDKGKALTAYQADIVFQDGHVHTFRGYSTQPHMDTLHYAVKRVKRYLNK